MAEKSQRGSNLTREHRERGGRQSAAKQQRDSRGQFAGTRKTQGGAHAGGSSAGNGSTNRGRTADAKQDRDEQAHLRGSTDEPDRHGQEIADDEI
jgi:hypothetical protein